MSAKKTKNVFKEGAISSEFIGESIAKHQTKTSIGAHNIFLGQVIKRLNFLFLWME